VAKRKKIGRPPVYKKTLAGREAELREVCDDIRALTEHRDILIKALHMEGKGCHRLGYVTGLHFTTCARIVKAMEGTEEDVTIILEGENDGIG
jgi:hypothetical protein